ncbi:MAG: hypothetical protein PUF03_02695 [Lachnospiraceae bacterium]|nr:hypothetical protein [Lachnospiraceae bacterium]
MKIKKRNIELAISVSIIMLLVLAYVHFADKEELLRVGNRIEEILHIHTNTSVVKMQSFIEVVTSGVLGSALVALFFYVQDYYCEREKVLHNAIEHINEFCKTYSEIPFCRYFENTDYAKLARAYYIEYYDNEFQLEVKKTADDYLKTIPKAARRVLKAEIDNKKFGGSYEAKSKLEKYLTEKFNGVEAESCKEYIEDELKTIIKEIDYKMEKAINAYQGIMELDMSEFDSLADSVTTFKKYGIFKKRFLKRHMLDIAIFPHLQISIKDLVTEQKRHVKAHKGVYNKVLAAYMVWDEYKCNTENVLKRIVRILKRTQKYTYSQFSMHNYSELKKYNKKELLVMLMILQKAFLGMDTAQILPEYEPILFSYNKVVYNITNLSRILLYELTERYEYRDIRTFAMVKDAYEKNQHIWSNSYSGEDLNSDFFRI